MITNVASVCTSMKYIILSLVLAPLVPCRVLTRSRACGFGPKTHQRCILRFLQVWADSLATTMCGSLRHDYSLEYGRQGENLFLCGGINVDVDDCASGKLADERAIISHVVKVVDLNVRVSSCFRDYTNVPVFLVLVMAFPLPPSHHDHRSTI